jgi:hypothetical protein
MPITNVPSSFRLLIKEIGNLLMNPRTIVLMALVGVLHFIVLLVIAPSGVVVFLLFEFGVVPLMFVPVAASLIVSDRHSGFAVLLVTGPPGHIGYFLSRFVLYFSLGVLILLGTLPFSIIALPPQGIESLRVLTMALAIGILSLFFAVSLGLLLSVLAGRRSSQAAMYLGFAMAFLLISVPTIAGGPITSAISSNELPLLVSIYHISPLIVLSDNLQASGDWFPLNPGVSLVPILIGAFIFLFSALLIFSRYQTLEGLNKSRPRQVATSVVTIFLFVAATMTLQADIVVPPKDQSPFVDGGSIHVDFSIDGEPPSQINVGTSMTGSVNLTLTTFGTSGRLFRDVSVHFRSLFVGSNWSDWEIGDVFVEGGFPSNSVFFNLPLRIQITGTEGTTQGFVTYRIIAISGDLVSYEVASFDLHSEPYFLEQAVAALSIYLTVVGALALYGTRRRNESRL